MSPCSIATPLMNQLPNGTITSPQGFRAGATYAGIQLPNPGQLDLGAVYSEEPAAVAGVFTTNKFRAPSVLWCQERVYEGRARAYIVNSGNANAGTGTQGMDATIQTAAWGGEKLGLPADNVLVCSTGVIGVQLPIDLIEKGIRALQLQEHGGHDFARAIMTTDTFPKEVAASVPFTNGMGIIGGVAKGSGMIHPNMATLLSFLTTDLAVEPRFLTASLRKAADCSFNMITVDGDNSTNDSLLILANGMAGNDAIGTSSPLAEPFQDALDEVCIYLAKCVARDGEGATKLIEVQVEGATALSDARLIARTVAGSMLVKSAVYGNDPNWGRVLAAAGRSGAPLDQEKVDVFLGSVCLMRNGQPQPFEHEEAQRVISQKDVVFRLDLHLGSAQATGWGCDLTEGYVHINAHYTT